MTVSWTHAISSPSGHDISSSTTQFCSNTSTMVSTPSWSSHWIPFFQMAHLLSTGEALSCWEVSGTRAKEKARRRSNTCRNRGVRYCPSLEHCRHQPHFRRRIQLALKLMQLIVTLYKHNVLHIRSAFHSGLWCCFKVKIGNTLVSRAGCYGYSTWPNLITKCVVQLIMRLWQQPLNRNQLYLCTRMVACGEPGWVVCSQYVHTFRWGHNIDSVFKAGCAADYVCSMWIFGCLLPSSQSSCGAVNHDASPHLQIPLPMSTFPEIEVAMPLSQIVAHYTGRHSDDLCGEDASGWTLTSIWSRPGESFPDFTQWVLLLALR